jgi:hypothetical protein
VRGQRQLGRVLVLEGPAEDLVSGRVASRALGGLLGDGDRLVPGAHVAEDVALDGQGPDAALVQPQRPFGGHERLLEEVAPDLRPGQQDDGVDVVGSGAGRALVGGRRFLVPLQGGQHRAQHAQQRRVVGRRPQRPLDGVERLLVAAGDTERLGVLLQQHDVVTAGAERPPEDADRLVLRALGDQDVAERAQGEQVPGLELQRALEVPLGQLGLSASGVDGGPAGQDRRIVRGQPEGGAQVLEGGLIVAEHPAGLAERRPHPWQLGVPRRGDLQVLERLVGTTPLQLDGPAHGERHRGERDLADSDARMGGPPLAAAGRPVCPSAP